jgi:hypothetical protein
MLEVYLVGGLIGALTFLVAAVAFRSLLAVQAIPEVPAASGKGKAPDVLALLPDSESIPSLLASDGVRVKLVSNEPLDDRRVTPPKANDPPPGWLAENWAMHEAVRASDAEWLLVTRGDAVFSPAAIASLVAYARSQRTDLVTAFGRQVALSRGATMALPALAQLLSLVSPIAAVNDPARPNVALAIEECVLVRRDAWNAAGGLKLVAMRDRPWTEFARLLKASGRTIALASGKTLFTVARYPSLAEFRRVWTSVARRFSGGRAALLVLAAAVAAAVNIGPFLLILIGLAGLLLNLPSFLWTMCGVLGLAQAGLLLGVRRLTDPYVDAPAWTLVTQPAAGLALAAVLITAIGADS